ncbi:MAG: phosphoribosyl-ATP pyrophosphohydrolase [Ruminococcaceae bacterium]|nr:phosphoribosyl-ATP pyrophosphohydrolase [Oscillospiraceae bacterium]
MALQKLVRDKIPEIIRCSGEEPVTRIMDDGEYLIALEKKLDEEVAEYHESHDVEELADVLEVVYALCEAQGKTIDDLMRVYSKKHEERGGFKEKIFLISKK